MCVGICMCDIVVIIITLNLIVGPNNYYSYYNYCFNIVITIVFNVSGIFYHYVCIIVFPICLKCFFS